MTKRDMCYVFYLWLLGVLLLGLLGMLALGKVETIIALLEGMQ